MSRSISRSAPGSVSWILENTVWLNSALIWVWFGFHELIGDRVGLVGTLDMFAVYFFVPLALTFPFLVHRRAARLWVVWAASMLVFVGLWHGLFLPRSSRAGGAEPTLRVMTYNVLGTQNDYQSLLDNIRDAHPDVVFLQEVNPEFAQHIATELANEFPFQVLEPKPGVNGMATISKYALSPTGESLGLVWVGTPQLLTLDWNGERVALVNFHTLPPRLSWEEYMRENFRIRNEQARAIAGYVEHHLHRGPMVCAGDLNAVQISTAYRTLRAQMNDAWLDGAIGPGNTFPNDTTIQPRMFRIDYIFASSRFATLRAFLARDEGGSDHRGVVADLAMTRLATNE